MASSSVSQWALLQQLLECLLSVAPFDCNWRCVGDVQHCRALSFLRADMHTERERERERKRASAVFDVQSSVGVGGQR